MNIKRYKSAYDRLTSEWRTVTLGRNPGSPISGPMSRIQNDLIKLKDRIYLELMRKHNMNAGRAFRACEEIWCLITQ